MQRRSAKSGVKKWSAKGECKGGVQRVECKRGECRGVSAEREPETYVNTLVCRRPRADSIAYAHAAGPGMIRKWLEELFGDQKRIEKS